MNSAKLHAVYPTFSSNFFDKEVFKEPKLDGTPPTREPILFSNEKYKHQSIEKFIKNKKDFKEFKKEYEALIGSISSFVEKHAHQVEPVVQPKEIDKINSKFNILKKHLFNQHLDYFGEYKAGVYGYAKELFHEFDQLLSNQKIPVQKRVDTVRLLADAVTVCTGGVITGLEDNLSKLKASVNGVEGRAFYLKIQIIDSLILDHVRVTHKNYGSGNEVHFVNIYFNHAAESLGLSLRDDPLMHRFESKISSDQRENCNQKLQAELKPDAFVAMLADEYLNIVKVAAINKQIPVDQTLEDRQIRILQNVIDDLKRSQLDGEYGEVLQEHYLLPTDESLFNFRLSDSSVPLATHFFNVLTDKALIDAVEPISFPNDDPRVGEIKMLGDLIWLEKDGLKEGLGLPALNLFTPQSITRALREQEQIRAKSYSQILQKLVSQVRRTYCADKREALSKSWKTVLSLIETPALADGVSIESIFDASTSLKEALQIFNICDAENINKTDGEGNTALMRAARDSWTDYMEQLLAANADLKQFNSNLKNVFELVAEKGDIDRLRKLVDAAADHPEKKALLGSALKSTVKNNDQESLGLLIEGGAEIELGKFACMEKFYSPVQLAAALGNLECLNLLLRAKAPNQFWGEDVYRLVLDVAVFHKQATLIRKFIDKGGDNAKVSLINLGNHLLHVAVSVDSIECLDALIDSGAKINRLPKMRFSHCNFEKYSALHAAVFKQRQACLKKLIKRKANLEIKTGDHLAETALLIAARTGYFTGIKMLLEAKADIRAKDGDGNGVLMVAAKQLGVIGVGNNDREADEKNKRACVKLLITSGAKLNEKNNEEVTPWEVIKYSDQKLSAELLIPRMLSCFK